MILSIIVPYFLIFLISIFPLTIAKDENVETTNIFDDTNFAEHVMGNIDEKLAGAVDAPSGTVELTPSSQWTFFNFGNTGTNVSTTFRILENNFTSLLITDLFYEGDSFAVYMADSYMGSSCLRPPSMLTSSSDPNATYGLTTPVQSYHCWTVPPNEVNVTIGVNQSPFTAGTAAIRLAAGNVCPINPYC